MRPGPRATIPPMLPGPPPVTVPLVLLAVMAAMTGLSAGDQAPSPSRQLQDAIQLLETSGDYARAIDLLKPLGESADRHVAARALLVLGDAYEKLGRNEARAAYQQVVTRFADQPAVVAEARARLRALDRAASRLAVAPTQRRPELPEHCQPIGPPTLDGRLLPGVDWNTASLVLMDPEKGTARYVTKRTTPTGGDGGYPSSAVVSPDASRIVYAWNSPKDWDEEYGELRVSALDGSGVRTLRRAPAEYVALGGWVPDGTKVLAAVYAERSASTDLTLVDLRDGTTERLASFPNGHVTAELSPDGRFVAYALQEPGSESYDIHVFEVETRAETARLAGTASDRAPAWLADSRHLVFTSNRGGSAGFWTVALDNGRVTAEPRLLKGDVGRTQFVGVTAGGTIFYQVQSAGADVAVSEFDPAARRWSTPRSLQARVQGSNYGPAFSPDGRHLAYITRREQACNLDEACAFSVIVRDRRTGDERVFRPDVTFPVRPRWSPDGRSLVFVANIQKDVYRLDVASGRFDRINQERPGFLSGWAEWAGDGGSVYYGVGPAIRRHDLRTHQDVVVYTAPHEAPIGAVRVSHDGRWLAFTHAGGGAMALHVASPDFAVLKTVLTMSGDYAADVVDWSADDRELVYFRFRIGDREQVGQLWRVPAAGGEPQNLGLNVRGMQRPAVSPDGRVVAFNQGQNGWETWMLEHFVPASPEPGRRARKRPVL